MFQLPTLPRESRKVQRLNARYKGIPCFDYDEVKLQRLIGAGGYGEVHFGLHKGREVVVKVLQYAEEKDILKEARFLFHLKHKNLVEFDSMCLQERALMLGYEQFDFSMFGKNKSVSSLDGLLRELDKTDCVNFEHLVPCIARQVIDGLIYLHGNGVAHRDLKPGNVLVSNKHFKRFTAEGQIRLWRENPCNVRLTDFGESWGNISQTSQIIRTHTNNIFKGTPAFMAPEVIDPNKRPAVLNEEQLKQSDIWSLGMLLFCLVNPDCQVPYLKEASQTNKKNWNDYLVGKISSGVENNCFLFNSLLFNSRLNGHRRGRVRGKCVILRFWERFKNSDHFQSRNSTYREIERDK